MAKAGEVAAAQRMRETITKLMSDGTPRGTGAVFSILYPHKAKTKPNGSPAAEFSRVSQHMRRLTEERVLRKIHPDSLRSDYVIAAKAAHHTTHDASGKPEPIVHDLPPATKRKYTKRNGNVVATASTDGNSALRSFLIRDIRMKLDELERLA